MHLSDVLYLTMLIPLGALSTNIVLSNDDGWAEINIRTIYDSLAAVGYSVVLSAPAENQSGKGALLLPIHRLS